MIARSRSRLFTDFIHECLLRRSRRDRTVLVPSLEGIQRSLMIHPCDIGPTGWLIACVGIDGQIQAAIETSGDDPARRTQQVTIVPGATHETEVSLEVRAGPATLLPILSCGRDLIVHGIEPGARTRWKLTWPGGTSLPMILRIVPSAINLAHLADS
jgi:hypothetical protein